MRGISLTTRGFILVGLPLIFQLAFAIALGSFLVQVQSEMLAQTESRQLISRATKMTGDLAHFAFSFSGEYEGDSAIARKKGECERIIGEMDSLLDLASTRPSDLPEIRFKQTITSLQATFARWQRAQRNGTQSVRKARGQIEEEAKVGFKAFGIALDELITKEESHYRENTLEKTASKEAIKSLFLFAALFSFLSTAALTYVYALLIRGPIERISTNGRLLAERKPLLPEIKSADEFEALDQMLHKVATALDEAAKKEAAMVDNAQDLICVLDQSGLFLTANAYSQAMLGYLPAELSGKSLGILTEPQSFADFQMALKSAVEREDELIVDLALKHRDGSLRESKWKGYWSKTDKSLFCVVNDTTEQKRIDLLKADFTEMLTSDLRKPLEDIQAAMNRIASSAEPLSETTNRQLATMMRSLQKLIVLVNDLLDKQRLSAGKLELHIESIEVRDLLEGAVEMVQGLAGAKKITLNLKPVADKTVDDAVENSSEKTADTIRGDRQKLTEVVVNLLGNAIKFTPAGASVTIGAARRGSNLEIAVTDSGPGVPPAMQEAIFQAFQQQQDAPTIGIGAASSTGTDTGSAGVGLGLAICKQIVEAHGGKIGVRVASSKTGTACPGSTFWFSLPDKKPRV